MCNVAPVNWTNTQIYNLIEMFQEREFLWNTSLNEYKDREKKHDAWCEIAIKLNLDKQIVEKKMKSLVGQFQRELRKLRSSIGDNETPKWFAFKKMMFLKDRYKPGTSTDSACEERYEETEREPGDDNEEGDCISREKGPEFTTPHIYSRRKRSRQRREHSNTSVGALSLLNNMYKTRQRRDEFDIFGEHVAMKLRKLKNCHAKNTAQFHINNILYSADMGDYDLPNNETRTSGASRSMNVDNFRHNTPGLSFVSESSNDGSVSTIEDIKCEIIEK